MMLEHLATFLNPDMRGNGSYGAEKAVDYLHVIGSSMPYLSESRLHNPVVGKRDQHKAEMPFFVVTKHRW